MSLHSSPSPVRRVIGATRNSLAGYRTVWREEQAFRMEVWLLVLLVPAAALIARSLTQFALLIFMWLLVLIAELANSAIEAAVDRIGHEIHALSGKAKDAGSAMVMTCIVAAVLVWGCVLVDNFVLL